MNSSLLSLLQLSDPALPIGGFSHSAGLETYVQNGIVHDHITAKEFITEMLTRNIQFTDATFVSLAYDAAQINNAGSIQSLDEECTAVKLPKELRQASQKMGMRLIKIFQSICFSTEGEKYLRLIQQKEANGHYCIAFGVYAQAMGIPKEDALFGFYYNAAAGFVTNCVKLIPIGQQQGQELLFSLQDIITGVVKNTIVPDRSMIGVCCAGFDIRSMQHEQLYSRLYMS